MCIHINVHIHEYVCVCVCVMHANVCVSVCFFMLISVIMYVCMYVSVRMYFYLCILHACEYVRACPYVRACVHVCIKQSVPWQEEEGILHVSSCPVLERATRLCATNGLILPTLFPHVTFLVLQSLIGPGWSPSSLFSFFYFILTV